MLCSFFKVKKAEIWIFVSHILSQCRNLQERCKFKALTLDLAGNFYLTRIQLFGESSVNCCLGVWIFWIRKPKFVGGEEKGEEGRRNLVRFYAIFISQCDYLGCLPWWGTLHSSLCQLTSPHRRLHPTLWVASRCDDSENVTWPGSRTGGKNF